MKDFNLKVSPILAGLMAALSLDVARPSRGYAASFSSRSLRNSTRDDHQGEGSKLRRRIRSMCGAP